MNAPMQLLELSRVYFTMLAELNTEEAAIVRGLDEQAAADLIESFITLRAALRKTYEADKDRLKRGESILKIC